MCLCLSPLPVLRHELYLVAGLKGAFATRMSGSSDLYARNARKPCHSINFVTAHDGFSLHDLVSYNSKHNEVRRWCPVLCCAILKSSIK